MVSAAGSLGKTIERLNKKNQLPRHVAIIMDGNGRWAKKKGLNFTRGHREGVERVRDIVEVSSAVNNLNTLTLFAFSTENWNRSNREINTLFSLLVEFIDREIERLVENEIRFQTIGKIEDFPERVQKSLETARSRTAAGKSYTLNVALNYGGRDEIVRMTQKIAAAAEAGEISPDEIDEQTVEKHLDTVGLPDPDLLIRTSGEKRISNFLLWQLAYTELYFSEKLWPDFSKLDYLKAIEEFTGRERRFGSRPGVEGEKTRD